MSPSDVPSDDELNLLMDMHNIPVPREPKQSFRVGDSVRIVTLVNGQKSYLSCRKSFVRPTTYRVKDLVDK